jgi:hypothetical protein
LEKTPPPGGRGEISADVIWGKKYEKVKRKKRKMKKEERGNKRVKLLQNREELRQKGHHGSRTTMCHKRGKKYHFQKGGNKYHFRTEI